MDKVRIGDICTVVSGSTPKSNIEEYWNGDIKWITPAEITDDSYVISDTERHITEKAVEKTNLTLLPVGAVLLSSRAPIGKTAIVGAEMYCNQGFKNLICSERIYNKYLYFFLTSKVDYLNALGRGATFKEISKGIVEDVEIPLPSLDEQKKIAERFEAIQQLISKRKQVLLHLDNLVKSRFIEMFGDLETNPKGWKTTTFDDVSVKITDGEHATVPRVEDGYIFLNARNVLKAGKIDLTGVTYISEENHNRIYKRCNPEPGDILLTTTGTIGNVAIVPEMDAFSMDRGITLIKQDRSVINSVFFAVAMQMDSMQMHMKNSIHASAIGHLFMNKVKALPIFVPPLDLQNQFADFVALTDKSKLAVQQSIETLQTLKAKLMQDYFG